MDLSEPFTTQSSLFSSDLAQVQNILENNKQIQELYLVRVWLEDIAASFTPPEEITTSYRSLTVKQLTQAVQHKNLDLVKEIDPDAPNRQDKKLVAEDQVCIL